MTGQKEKTPPSNTEYKKASEGIDFHCTIQHTRYKTGKHFVSAHLFRTFQCWLVRAALAPF